MITVEEQLAELHGRLKKLERSQVKIGSGTLSAANTSNQTGSVTLPDGTVIANVGVVGNYIPEAGQQVHFLINGTQPIIYPPTAPIVSAPPAQVNGVVITPGIGSIIVRWSALTEADVKWNRGYYQVQLDTVNTFNSGNLKSQDSPGTVSVFTELTPATTYYVRVRGVDYVGTVSGSWSATASIAAGSPAASTITGQITNTQIADDSITSPKILANTILAGDIFANTITASEIAADAVTSSELAALNIAVGKYIRSTTYVAGSSGWSIAADGSAEFNNVTVRGTVAAGTIKASTMTGIAGTNIVTNPGAETNTTGWATSNCTLARDTTVKRTGAGSFKLTASSAADMYIETPTGTGGFPVVPGVTYSATAYFKTVVTKRTCKVEMRFFDSGGAFTHAVNVTYQDGTNFWRSIQATSGALPAGDAFCSVRLTILAPANAEIHNIDDVALQPTSTMISDLYTGTAGSPAIAVYSDYVPQILMYSGIDGEIAGQIYRTTYEPNNAIDLTTMSIYSGAPSGGTAAFLQLDSTGVVSGTNRLCRINAERVYLHDGSVAYPLLAHASGTTAFGVTTNTASTLPVEPGTTLRITNFVKRHAESYIVVRMTGNSMFSTTGVACTIKLYVNDSAGGNTEVARTFVANAAGAVVSCSGSVYILGGSAAGNYTFQWRWLSSNGNTINMDGNSSYSIEVEEICAP